MSAMDNPTSVNDKLSKKLAAGRIVGPFNSPPFETFRVSPLDKDKLRASSVIHILDDFLFIGPSEAKCQVDLDNFLCVCRRIGVPIADEKTMAPLILCNSRGLP